MNLLEQPGFGYRFDPSACAACGGRCCRGESGYIWITPEEEGAIAGFLELEPAVFRERFLRKAGDRFSIREVKANGQMECIFFKEGTGCVVYPVRPFQCRTFPFWERFKTHEKEVREECPGIV